MRNYAWMVSVSVQSAKNRSGSRLIEVGDFNELGGYQAMVRLLDKPKDFSAVIALNDQMAYGAMLALSEAGLDIPGDISLLGFDDLPHSAYRSAVDHDQSAGEQDRSDGRLDRVSDERRLHSDC